MDVKFFLTLVVMFVMTSHCSALLGTCGNDAACTADQANSKCDLSSDLDNAGDGDCVCDTDFKDDGSGGCTAKVLGDSCTAGECSGVSNGECDTTTTNNCVCSTGYTASGGVCSTSDNSGVSIVPSMMSFLCMFAIIFLKSSL